MPFDIGVAATVHGFETVFDVDIDLSGLELALIPALPLALALTAILASALDLGLAWAFTLALVSQLQLISTLPVRTVCQNRRALLGVHSPRA